ncbi:16S rRNA (uracil(1498)-N(3))-methyltransferase [Thalassospiraceae bacterium LMO-JJ14]|nr:16S rRNA (uracil(1498)-N(3))-methyltransferase [Thalassospiraceae bacterium LMO-JJ14]
MAATPSIRLFVDMPLQNDAALQLSRAQSHYLVNVMRKGAGTALLLFNGTDGEWAAELSAPDKKSAGVSVLNQTRPQVEEPDVWLLFAPLKKDRTDFLVEKATELGASRIQPVMTKFTQASRLNTERLQATATEAAEQSRRLSVPVVSEPGSLDSILAAWPHDRPLIYLDETGHGQPLANILAGKPNGLAFLIGPEGGFAAEELDALGKLTFSVAADLGPRILRAETAATAALAIRQSVADISDSTS